VSDAATDRPEEFEDISRPDCLSSSLSQHAAPTEVAEDVAASKSRISAMARISSHLSSVVRPGPAAQGASELATD